LADAVLHQCVRPLVRACCAPGHHGYQRACELVTGQTSIGPFGSPVFACAGKTDPPSRLILSQTSAGELKLRHRLLLLAYVPLFVPCGRSFVPAYDRQSRRAEERSRPAVALSSRACSTAARPRLDGSEHGARIKPVGTLSQPSRCTRRLVLYGGPPRRCGRACWRARSPARCGAIAFWPPRSRTSGHSAPTVLT
jgi:hypothetical protein